MIGLIGEIVGTTTGGYLGSLLTILPFVLRSIFMLLGMLPLFFLPEQKIEASERTSALRHFGQRELELAAARRVEQRLSHDVGDADAA